MQKILKRVICVIGSAAAAVLLFFLIANCILLIGTGKRVLTLGELSDIEEYKGSFDVIVVLGAGVRPGGVPSDMLRDRLEVGNELYFAGYADKILMSGDHMSPDYDEVGVMKRYAIEAGVPTDAIYLDHAGLSTYDSLWRLANIFEAKKVLIVTQSYHLPRALYLARAFGINAYGLSADLRPYRSQTYRDIREILARGKDFVLAITKPSATYVGTKISLNESGENTNENPFWKEGT
ncbi:MAG: SanA protein [Ruminococcaceae bacterium]|nr:SanA protein [Oscillospiraceae bacterium]